MSAYAPAELQSPLRQLNHRRRTTLDNIVCPYCGVALAAVLSDEDHVIGRRFVPKGKLAGSWNLVVRACKDCNARKAELEDDISALTMQPTAFGNFAKEDPVLRAEAARKARGSTSRRTNKYVSDSIEETQIRLTPWPGVKSTFGLVCGPQVDQRRAFALAKLQVQGFFFWMTYDETTRLGGRWIDAFLRLQAVSRPDWGNQLQLGFMDLVKDWNTRLVGIAADGYFKVIIRKGPTTTLWSWAVEWNHSHRLIGLVGRKDEIRAAEARLPELVVHTFREDDRTIVRMRQEVALTDEDDSLFVVPEPDKP